MFFIEKVIHLLTFLLSGKVCKFWILLSWIILFQPIYAQQIDVSEGSFTIQGKSLSGFLVCLELDSRTVESGLGKYVRSLGKFDKEERNSWAGLAQMIPALSSDAVDFYAKLAVSPRCVQVFMAANRAGTTEGVGEDSRINLRKLLYDFALEQYRTDLMKQISEAERIVNLAVKAHDKRSREAEDLKSRIKRNRREKVRLLEDIDQNAKNLQQLLSDSVRNIAELETALEEIKKVRLIAEERKQKLGQVK